MPIHTRINCFGHLHSSGKCRREVFSQMAKKDPAAVKLGRRGGKVAARNRTAQERAEQARKAANTRWAKRPSLVFPGTGAWLAAQIPLVLKDLKSHAARQADTADEQMPTKDRRPRTAEDFDFSKWMVYGAELPLSNSDLNDLGSRFDRMLSSSFDQLRKESGHENAGREITLNAWDEYVFESIQEYGPLVLLSHYVLRRIFEWQCQNPTRRLTTVCSFTGATFRCLMPAP